MGKRFFERMDRLRDLYRRWGFKTQALRRLNGQAGELQVRNDLSPSLLRRLGRWMEQIAGLEEKERAIVSEIAEVESRHRALRKAQKLRRAAPAAELPFPAPERDKKSRVWEWLLLLWIMRNRRHKKAP